MDSSGKVTGLLVEIDDTDRRRRFVREGRASPAYMIERYAQDRRHAILAAAIHDLEGRLTGDLQPEGKILARLVAHSAWPTSLLGVSSVVPGTGRSGVTQARRPRWAALCVCSGAPSTHSPMPWRKEATPLMQSTRRWAGPRLCVRDPTCRASRTLPLRIRWSPQATSMRPCASSRRY
jgi:hypothetical protein